MSSQAKHAKRKHRALPIVAGVILLLFAVALIAYPFISNVYYDYIFSQEFDKYTDAVEHIEDTTLKDAIALAQEYNAALASGKDLPVDYDSALNLYGNGLMGYVQIPMLKLKLPIYHSADYTVLETAIGHLSNTSLPVGGRGTHCILTGHSGIASQRLFSDIDQMEIGDTFYLDIAGEQFWYQVDDISVVLPHELDSLAAIPGEDHCTLVTCTPYGVNTHRLLVRGVRIPTPEEDGEDNASTQVTESTHEVHSTWMTKYFTALAISVIVIIIVLVAVYFIKRYLKRKKVHLKNTPKEPPKE